jgi:hypothetical protein
MPQCLIEGMRRLAQGAAMFAASVARVVGEVTNVAPLIRAARGSDEGGNQLSTGRRLADGTLALAGMVPTPGAGPANATRVLKAADLGVDGLRTFDATLSVAGGTATVAVGMVEGEMRGASLISALKALAQSEGASVLRIEGSIANERLYNALKGRYGLQSAGGKDFLEIPLK